MAAWTPSGSEPWRASQPTMLPEVVDPAVQSVVDLLAFAFKEEVKEEPEVDPLVQAVIEQRMVPWGVEKIDWATLQEIRL